MLACHFHLLAFDKFTFNNLRHRAEIYIYGRTVKESFTLLPEPFGLFVCRTSLGEKIVFQGLNWPRLPEKAVICKDSIQLKMRLARCVIELYFFIGRPCIYV